MRNYFIAIPLFAILFSGAGCLDSKQIPLTPISLEYWRTEDSLADFATIIADYQKIHPNITVTVKTFRPEDFESRLIEALAEDRGPDLFNLSNVQLREWQSKLLPMPKETKITTPVADAQKRMIPTVVTTPTPTKATITRNFVDTVLKDVVTSENVGGKFEDSIVGLPLSVGTLALFYNRDLLKKANIDAPPSNWQELQDQAIKLTILDAQQKITQSGAALGTSKNVRHFSDILSILLMQRGIPMTDDVGSLRFAGDIRGGEILHFYRSFADPQAQQYVWNNDLPNSFETFAAGKTAFYFGFPTDEQMLREQSPKLQFDIAPLPQIDPGKPANIAHYFVETVSKKTKFPNEAWDFLIFATNAENAASYLAATGRPTALRSLVARQQADHSADPFVTQLLTARTWYRGKDYKVVERAFDEAISTPVDIQEKVTYSSLLSDAALVISGSLR